MSKNKKQWFICTNCMAEVCIDDLGIFLSEEDNKIAHFCGFCGWWEFIPSEEHDWDNPKNEKILEEGPKRYYKYPKNIVKHTKHEFLIERHEENLEKQELETDLPDFSKILK
jgi:hypothetical protein